MILAYLLANVNLYAADILRFYLTEGSKFDIIRVTLIARKKYEEYAVRFIGGSGCQYHIRFQFPVFQDCAGTDNPLCAAVRPVCNGIFGDESVGIDDENDIFSLAII